MIRKKILLFNLLTLIPIILFVLFLNLKNYQNNKSQNIQELKNLAEIVSLENKRIIESVRQILVSFSVIYDINYKTIRCSTFLSDALSKYQRYGNFGVTDNLGNLLCSAVNTNEKLNLADRFFFRETLNKKDFVIGEYVISKATKRASINFGYPLENKSGIVYATLDLNWLNDFIENLSVDDNTVILILDKKGLILSRSPYSEDVIGKEFSTNFVSSLNADSGIFETKGIDGVSRIYAYEKINSGENDSLFVVVGKEKRDIYNVTNREFINQSLISILLITISILAGYYIGGSIINGAVEKLNEIEKIRQDFISLVSHQLRTPATSIKWFTEILLTGKLGKINIKQKRILKDSHISIKRMIELIGNVLSITKLENGKIKLESKNIDITNLTNNVLKNVNKEFKNKNIRHKLSSKSDKLFTKVDEKLFYQAIYNLINNAFKYTPNKGFVNINIYKNKKIYTLKLKIQG